MIKPPSAAVVDKEGKIRSLVSVREPEREVTEDQVTKPTVLARLLKRLVGDLTALGRRPSPRRIDFEDVDVVGDGATVYLFPHGLAGRVRWWVVDCVGDAAALHRDEESSTDDVLALLSNAAATVTVRIEEVGG